MFPHRGTVFLHDPLQRVGGMRTPARGGAERTRLTAVLCWGFSSAGPVEGPG
jgi:hypothetical protein